MTRAIVLVPAPDYSERWDWAYDVEAAALADGGLDVEPRPWTQPGEFEAGDIVLPLVVWGYHDDPARWHVLLDRLEASSATIVNPVPVLRWNSDKAYLAELGSRGVPTIPTIVADRLDAAQISEARERIGNELVIKPPVSAAATGTFKLGPADPIPAAALGRRMMIQPFYRSVTQEGEYSLLYFDGEFSHALVKRPSAGDYRVQPHLGGREAPCEPPAGARAVAEAALAAAPEPPAYARVDLLRDDSGALRIIELELIEPSLWLEHAPDRGASFAAAIRKRASH
jgi:glutathione synthase/RimK-type ligase-like ATP-grasp enzyme